MPLIHATNVYRHHALARNKQTRIPVCLSLQHTPEQRDGRAIPQQEESSNMGMYKVRWHPATVRTPTMHRESREASRGKGLLSFVLKDHGRDWHVQSSEVTNGKLW